jgi:hypothetical protein
MIALSLPAAHPCASHAIGAVSPRPGVQQAGAAAVAGEQVDRFMAASHLENQATSASCTPHRYSSWSRNVVVGPLYTTTSQRGAAWSR